MHAPRGVVRADDHAANGRIGGHQTAHQIPGFVGHVHVHDHDVVVPFARQHRSGTDGLGLIGLYQSSQRQPGAQVKAVVTRRLHQEADTYAGWNHGGRLVVEDIDVDALAGKELVQGVDDGAPVERPRKHAPGMRRSPGSNADQLEIGVELGRSHQDAAFITLGIDQRDVRHDRCLGRPQGVARVSLHGQAKQRVKRMALDIAKSHDLDKNRLSHA